MRWLKITGAVTAVVLFTFAVASLVGFFYFTRDLPSLATLHEYQPNLITEVYSEDGSVIGEFYIERRVVVSLKKMPPHLINAFLAAEDAKFFEHEGLDYIGILRALIKNITAGRIVQGGSTITQQVARSFFLTHERRISRKIREAILAFRIENNLSKEEILHLYLNQIYLGNGAYGVQAAAETYFGKDVEGLDVAEAALIAGLPKAPSRYSPYTNPGLAKTRQEFVLTRMLEEGHISRFEAEKAINQVITLRPSSHSSLWIGPYFTEYVRRYIEEKYGEERLYKGGLRVYTTMDIALQKAANKAITDGLEKHDKRRGYRGPVMELKSDREIVAFIAETDRQLAKRPLRVGGVYRGLITSTDSKDGSLHISIGSKKGFISRRALKWAELYNPTQDPDGGVKVNTADIFSVGDVVEVKVMGLPEAEQAVELSLEQSPLAQAALIAIEPETGYIKAMVGGLSFAKSQFNRALQARRQPGSAFKPIIYTAAIENGYTPATIVIDSPIVFEDRIVDEPGEERPEEEGALEDAEPKMNVWKPRNYGEKFHGPTTIRTALTKSRNVVTIKVLQDIGVGRAISYARLLGIESPLARNLSLALGSSGVSLLELTRAFATFANLGVRPEPLFITKVLDSDSNVLEQNEARTKRVLSPQTSYIITNLLQGVIENGTGRRARALKRPAAGKTGTTNNLNDAWFIGFVPGLATGTWIGYDEERPLGDHETGARAALPIWLQFMQSALKGTPRQNFPIPDCVDFVKIDPESGKLATAKTENPIFEVFICGTAPTESAATDRPTTPDTQDFFRMDTEALTDSEGLEFRDLTE